MNANLYSSKIVKKIHKAQQKNQGKMTIAECAKYAGVNEKTVGEYFLKRNKVFFKNSREEEIQKCKNLGMDVGAISILLKRDIITIMEYWYSMPDIVFDNYYQKITDQFLSKIQHPYFSELSEMEGEIFVPEFRKRLGKFLKRVHIKNKNGRKALKLRFGTYDNMFRSLRETGEILGSSYDNVRQTEKRVFKTLRNEANQKILDKLWEATK